MNCVDARHLILTADPEALRARVDAALRQHLEGCASCAAASRHVVDDVARLRAALIARGASRVSPRPRPSRAKRVALTLVPVALAAELAAFAFLGNGDTTSALANRKPVIDDSVTSLLPVTRTHIDTGDVMVAPKKVRHVAAKQIASAKDTTLTADTAATVVPSEYVSAEQMAQLQVTPASRRERLAVIATSNPKITVVWLSKVDSL